MNISHRIPISKNLLLKLSSLLLGYALWYALSCNTICTRTLTIPVYCYNQTEQHQTESPESIDVTLRAARSFMRLVDDSSLAAHVDVRTLGKGTNYITLSHKELLLPQEISVSHYTPLLIVDTIT